MEIKEKIDELLKAKEWASEVVRLRHEIRGLL